MNQQSSSSLFSLPLELRQAIYSLLLPYGAHVSERKNGNVLFSACIQSPTHPNLFGGEREPPSDSGPTDSSHSLYQQRLRSAWGPHWECEEVSDHPITWLDVCKRSKTEMLQYLMSAATLHVAGLEDLQLVLLLTDLELNNPLQIALSEVCHLDVILRLPLRIFEDINRATKEGCLNNLPEKVRLWVRLCSAVPNLPKLSTLRFWIDHDKSKTWTVVNERAFLAPLDTIAAVRPELEITVNLPLLHPKLESWERHFVPGCSPPAYIIERRVRQRWHVVKQGTGSGVRYVSDFPILFEGDWSSDDSLETTQREERKMWESGVDVEQEKRDRSAIASYIPGYSNAGTSSDTDDSDSGDQSHLVAEVREFLRQS